MLLNQINCCVLIPTYNNSTTLGKVIEGVLQYSTGNDVIVINDGSTDNTSQILREYEGKISVIDYEQNRGKGYALRCGFKEAISRGFENAITIDSDGQHFPDDIPAFITAALQHPGTMLMGSRNMNQADVPGKSSFGNKFSNFWFKFETGITLPDTQTGYRLYPLAPLKKIKLYTNKFETEIEVIVKLAWRNVPFLSVPVKVIYKMDNRVTHFRPFRDFSRISVLNTVLVTLTLLYYLPRRILMKIFKKGLWNIIKEELVKKDESNFMKAISVGFGVFMGIVPIWGFQLLTGIPLSIFFKMNKALFILAANISLPPLIPVIIYASYKAGGLLIDNKVEFSSLDGITPESIHVNFMQYFVGAWLLALAAGMVAFIAMAGTLAVVRPAK